MLAYIPSSILVREKNNYYLFRQYLKPEKESSSCLFHTRRISYLYLPVYLTVSSFTRSHNPALTTAPFAFSLPLPLPRFLLLFYSNLLDYLVIFRLLSTRLKQSPMPVFSHFPRYVLVIHKISHTHSFLILSNPITTHIHLNIFISVTFVCISCFFIDALTPGSIRPG